MPITSAKPPGYKDWDAWPASILPEAPRGFRFDAVLRGGTRPLSRFVEAQYRDTVTSGGTVLWYGHKWLVEVAPEGYVATSAPDGPSGQYSWLTVYDGQVALVPEFPTVGPPIDPNQPPPQPPPNVEPVPVPECPPGMYRDGVGECWKAPPPRVLPPLKKKAPPSRPLPTKRLPVPAPKPAELKQQGYTPRSTTGPIVACAVSTGVALFLGWRFARRNKGARS